MHAVCHVEQVLESIRALGTFSQAADVRCCVVGCVCVCVCVWNLLGTGKAFRADYAHIPHTYPHTNVKPTTRRSTVSLPQVRQLMQQFKGTEIVVVLLDHSHREIVFTVFSTQHIRTIRPCTQWSEPISLSCHRRVVSSSISRVMWLARPCSMPPSWVRSVRGT